MAGKLTIAGSAAEAVSLKDAGSVFLAGGTEINRLGSTITAGHLISIKRVEELKEIKESVGLVSIGAGCTFSEVLASDLVPAYMKEACRFMASQTKRNMATIGGCAALLRSDSYIIPTLMAAKAKLELLEKDGDERIICIETYLEEKETYKDMLITAIILPGDDRPVLSKRYANTAQSHAVLTVSMGGDGNKDISIAAAIKNAGIYDLSDLAVELESDPDMTEEEIIDWVYGCERIAAADDIFGSEKYKRYLLGVTVSLMLEQLRKGGAR